MTCAIHFIGVVNVLMVGLTTVAALKPAPATDATGSTINPTDDQVSVKTESSLFAKVLAFMFVLPNILFAIAYIVMLVSKNAHWMARAALANLAIMGAFWGLTILTGFSVGAIINGVIQVYFLCYTVAWMGRYASKNSSGNYVNTI